MVEPHRREITEEQYHNLERVALRYGLKPVENCCVEGVFDIYAPRPGNPPFDAFSLPHEGQWVGQVYPPLEGSKSYGVLWDPTLAMVDGEWAEGIERFVEDLAGE